VHFQRLLREPPASLLGGVVDNDIDPLEPTTPLAEITRRMATYNLVCMPVVDSADRLVGAVTVDDLLDHLLPPHWRDRDHPEASLGVPVVPHLARAPASIAGPDGGPREGNGRG
jgi:Mg/Co/Ni transporter MgtE